MCILLDKALDKFKRQVKDTIDSFEGKIYTSSMIPIVIKVQQLFREKKRRRYEQMMAEKMEKAGIKQRRRIKEKRGKGKGKISRRKSIVKSIEKN